MRETLVREAVWTLRTEEDRARSPLTRSDRWGPLALALLILGTVVASLWATSAGVQALVAMIGLGATLIGISYRSARRADEWRNSYKALQDDFERVSGHFVTLVVRQGDAPTGLDEGVLWFEEGRLYFVGRRTSFGLVPGQARALAPPRPTLRGFRNSVELVLRRDTPAGAMALSFEPLLPPYESVPVHRAALRTDLDHWLGGWSEGAGQFPPTPLGPGVPSVRRLFTNALIATVPVPLFVLLATLPYAWGPTVAFLALIAAVTALPASNLRWRALRDLRTLEAGA